MRVLIIDDEELIGKCLGRVAFSRGHTVKIEKDGLKGLSAWKKFQPHLVFLDILMPGLDGPSLLKKVGKKNNERVVMMSAHRAFGGSVSIPGVDLFITKPFKDIELVFTQAEQLFLLKGQALSIKPVEKGL